MPRWCLRVRLQKFLPRTLTGIYSVLQTPLKQCPVYSENSLSCFFFCSPLAILSKRNLGRGSSLPSLPHVKGSGAVGSSDLVRLGMAGGSHSFSPCGAECYRLGAFNNRHCSFTALDAVSGEGVLSVGFLLMSALSVFTAFRTHPPHKASHHSSRDTLKFIPLLEPLQVSPLLKGPLHSCKNVEHSRRKTEKELVS